MRDTSGSILYSGIPQGDVITVLPPEAINLGFLGLLRVGEVVTAAYNYYSQTSPEGNTTYQWYLADDGIGTNRAPIIGETSVNYTVQAGDLGKWLSCEITPVDDLDVSGTTVETPPREVGWNSFMGPDHWTMSTAGGQQSMIYEDGIYKANYLSGAWQQPAIYDSGGVVIDQEWLQTALPTKCRITFDFPDPSGTTEIHFSLKKAPTEYLFDGNITSGQIINISYGTYPWIGYMTFQYVGGNDEYWEMSNIEFYG